MREGLFLLLLVSAGCASDPAQRPRADAAQALPQATAERSFGAPVKQPGQALDVTQVLLDPGPYLNQTVTCVGTVARVCENAGCWLELRPSANKDAAGLRVPLAGHSFFVPQDIVGRVAVVEGKLAQRALAQAELDHLQGEGLKAVGPLYLAATGVVVR